MTTTCPVCAAPVTQAPTGRPIRFCSTACRVRSHRWRSTPEKRGRVLVACEYSGRVRDAFAARGWDAWSCDLLDAETPGNHYKGDVRKLLYSYPGNKLAQKWDLLIAHPPCDHLAVSGAKHFAEKPDYLQRDALGFVSDLMAAPVPHIAIENPASIVSTRIRPKDQTIQPYEFGHGETKTTWLWLTNLPHLQPTNVVEGREARVHRMPPGPNRWKERSRTFAGIAVAMADQWGRYVEDSLTL